jgi:hypothetical protein
VRLRGPHTLCGRLFFAAAWGCVCMHSCGGVADAHSCGAFNARPNPASLPRRLSGSLPQAAAAAAAAEAAAAQQQQQEQGQGQGQQQQRAGPVDDDEDIFGDAGTDYVPELPPQKGGAAAAAAAAPRCAPWVSKVAVGGPGF